ncbi:MAG: prolyl oligopeptidase family serine peptidase [Legionella sp.]|nr:prolyl oligopeptidase family serine peptidase [Legionella sp.]
MKFKMNRLISICLFLFINTQSVSQGAPFEIKMVSFSSGPLLLKGIIYKPKGSGPFPAILFNHGSSFETHEASDALGPLFASHGWVFFMPSRRGQGLSRHVGHYIINEIDNARNKGGDAFAVDMMVQLLKGDHLNDQMAALAWLRKQSFVASNKIAVAGVSFGGIQTVLGVEKANYCAAINAAGAAQSWSKAPQLHKLMLHAVKNAKAPIFFFQAGNDYDLSPTNVLSTAMKETRKNFK